jgi:hypothetical protein
MATGIEWSKKGTAARVSGAMQVMVIDPAEATTAGRNKRITLDQIKALFGGQDPPPPAGTEWVNKPTASVSGTTLAVTAGSADFNGTTVTYNAATFTAALPGEGFMRQDAVAGKADGTYLYLTGQTGSTAVTPNIPSDALFVAYILFSASGGQVVEPAEFPTDPTPVLLTDAATVTFNTDTGKIRENAALTLTGQLQTLVLSNTKAGYFYQVRLKNCTGQQVTLSPVSGVSYVGLDGQALTTVTLPAGGDCMLSYYHASNTERVIELLDGSTGTGTSGDYLPLNNPNGNTVNFGGNNYLDLQEGFADIYVRDISNGRRSGSFATTDGISSPAGVPAISGAFSLLDAWRNIDTNATVASVIAFAKDDGTAGIRLYARDTATNKTAYFDFLQDGKLYINGTEFTGGTGSTVTVDSALSDTSTNPVQNKVVKQAIDANTTAIANKVNTSAIVQTVGTSTTAVMSQKAVTDMNSATRDLIGSETQKFVHLKSILSVYAATTINISSFQVSKKANNNLYVNYIDNVGVARNTYIEGKRYEQAYQIAGCRNVGSIGDIVLRNETWVMSSTAGVIRRINQDTFSTATFDTGTANNFDSQPIYEDSANNIAWIGGSNNNTLLAIDLTTLAVRYNITLPANLQGYALLPVAKRVIVLHSNNQYSLYNTETGALVITEAFGSRGYTGGYYNNDSHFGTRPRCENGRLVICLSAGIFSMNESLISGSLPNIASAIKFDASIQSIFTPVWTGKCYITRSTLANSDIYIFDSLGVLLETYPMAGPNLYTSVALGYDKVQNLVYTHGGNYLTLIYLK